jgi:sulfatase maturation enzyme AslB (radical SAM superfamily)
MNDLLENHLNTVLSHLYINPLEKCNLRCEICYTRKTSPILSAEAITEFINRYKKEHTLETITFCGGEVFTLPYFPSLVNSLTQQGIFIQIITNGTVNRLTDLEHPNLINLIVSLDGLEMYHDANRGKGNFRKSMEFLQDGISRGFHTEVFSIVTKQNMPHIDAFEQYLTTTLEKTISVTYHPRKPPSYLLHHPVSNIVGKVNGFDFLEPQEMISLMNERKTFPPKNLGCYQIALTSNGKVYACCEGISPIGSINDDITILFDQMRTRLILWEKAYTLNTCLGCTSPDFVCGIKPYES